MPETKDDKHRFFRRQAKPLVEHILFHCIYNFVNCFWICRRNELVFVILVNLMHFDSLQMARSSAYSVITASCFLYFINIVQHDRKQSGAMTEPAEPHI